MPPDYLADASEVALEDLLVVVAGHPLPEGTAQWPFHVVSEEAGVLLVRERGGPYVLCGTAAACERLLGTLCEPRYVVTDSDAPVLAGRANVTVALAQNDWEAVVAAVCSRHLSTIAQMVLRWARVTPEQEAVCDPIESVTYAELCSRAWSLGEVLGSHGAAAGDSVGVVLSPSVLTTVCLLGIALRRLTACTISDFSPRRALQMDRVRCVVLLAAEELPTGAYTIHICTYTCTDTPIHILYTRIIRKIVFSALFCSLPRRYP